MAQTILQKWSTLFGGDAAADVNLDNARKSSAGMTHATNFGTPVQAAENLAEQSFINSANPIASGRSFGILGAMLQAVNDGQMSTRRAVGTVIGGIVDDNLITSSNPSADMGDNNTAKANRVLAKIIEQGNTLVDSLASVQVQYEDPDEGGMVDVAGFFQAQKRVRSNFRMGPIAGQQEAWNSLTDAANADTVEGESNPTISLLEHNGLGQALV